MASPAAAAVTPATSSPIVLEARHWRRVLELTGLPFRLDRGSTTWFELHCQIPGGGAGAAEMRAAAMYALMDVNDAIAGRAWAPTLLQALQGLGVRLRPHGAALRRDRQPGPRARR